MRSSGISVAPLRSGDKVQKGGLVCPNADKVVAWESEEFKHEGAENAIMMKYRSGAGGTRLLEVDATHGRREKKFWRR